MYVCVYGIGAELKFRFPAEQQKKNNNLTLVDYFVYSFVVVDGGISCISRKTSAGNWMEENYLYGRFILDDL